MILPREQRIAEHKHFLEANVARLDSFSDENYQSADRGMVVVIEEHFLDGPSQPQRHLPLPLLKTEFT